MRKYQKEIKPAINFQKFSILAIIWLTLFSCRSNTEPQTSNAEGSTETAVVTDPLPSWNEGASKTAIVDFVKSVTDSGNASFIPEAERIATFDNDGTLWSEQPAYFQLFFAMDRIKEMAPSHPEWKNKQPFKAILEDNMTDLMKSGEKGLLAIVLTTHGGMTTDEFEKIVKDWISTARHPTTKRPYTDMVFQPMLELLAYLRSNGFKTFIVSGGGMEFMRPWAEKVYGIPPEQVVGTSFKTEYDYNNGHPVIKRLPEVEFIDDKEGKPLGINKYIGRKPVFAAGNSDGDLQMLRWAASNPLKNFELYVHHTDSTREWAYDRSSHFGALDKGLDEAKEKGWLLVDMKQDWKVIHPFELK